MEDWTKFRGAGLARFPLTLYKEHWLRILASAPEIEAFIREKDSKLKTKE